MQFDPPSFVQKEISLADKNWFKTGGNAEYFVEVLTDQMLQEALVWARALDLQITILGHGANVLISDAGIKGLTILIGSRTIQVDGNLVSADAGCSVDQLIQVALDHQLTGLEDFSGIPGSIGGAVCMNIHYFDSLLSDVFIGADLLEIESGRIISVDNKWFGFGYDQSQLLYKKHILLRARFALKKASLEERWYAKGRRDEIIRQRNRRYPKERTCGSFFRNFLPDEYVHARGAVKVPYVAYYLESVGVKGQLHYGGASVFALHANMLVTKAGATSSDLVELVKKMQQKVYDHFGLWPIPECQLLGFVPGLFDQK
jgi:UDP-N-acetylmuramate dehydrogenase